MKLTQALGKSSLIIDGAEDNAIASNPDENGGFGLDTWDNEIIKILFSVIPENERYNMKKGILGGRGISIYHRFTKEHCERILEKLSTFKEIRIKEKNAFFISESYGGIYSEWFQRLIDLFSDFNNLPVYYWCD